MGGKSLLNQWQSNRRDQINGFLSDSTNESDHLEAVHNLDRLLIQLSNGSLNVIKCDLQQP